MGVEGEGEGEERSMSSEEEEGDADSVGPDSDSGCAWSEGAPRSISTSGADASGFTERVEFAIGVVVSEWGAFASITEGEEGFGGGGEGKG